MVPETTATLWAIFDFGVCALPGVLARLLLQYARQDESNPSFWKTLALIGGSLMLAVMIALICTEVERLKAWSRVAAFSGGFLAQDAFTWILNTKEEVVKMIARRVREKYEKPKR